MVLAFITFYINSPRPDLIKLCLSCPPTPYIEKKSQLSTIRHSISQHTHEILARDASSLFIAKWQTDYCQIADFTITTLCDFFCVVCQNF